VEERTQIAEIKGGNREVFGQVFENYYANLCDFASSIVRSPDVAEDVVQHVFISIWQERARWNPSGTLQSYLYKAVKNESISVLRKVGVREKYALEVATRMGEEDPSPHQALEDSDFFRAVKESIMLLPERRRSIFVLYFFHGLMYQEIADALQISTSTIHVQLKRATVFLKNRLQSMEKA
jgi:RNA polymerase sigma-70 factor, ECF subfamily